jgi:hypothetical protein
MSTCPECGAARDRGSEECSRCGSRRPPEAEAVIPVDDTEATDGTDSDAEPTTSRWVCSKCQTRVEPGFDVCWNCGTSIEGVEDPTFVVADEAEPEDEAAVGSILTCPKCAGNMHEGFLPDYHGSGLSTRIETAAWVPGVPESSMWTGTWVGRERHRLRAFRCEDCAFVEFYARD